jgi:hypothetical protein
MVLGFVKKYYLFFVYAILVLLNGIIAISFLSILILIIYFRNSDFINNHRWVLFLTLLFLLINIIFSFFNKNPRLYGLSVLSIWGITLIFVNSLNNIFIKFDIYKTTNSLFKDNLLALYFIFQNTNWLLKNKIDQY